MTAFRFALCITISYFASAMLFPPSLAQAEDILLRRAATPSSSGSIQGPNAARPEDPRAGSKKTTIGLSPVPYKPETPQEPVKEPVVRQGGYPDIKGLIRKVNQSVVSIRMLDSNSSWSLGNLGFSGDSNGKATGYGSGFIVSSTGHILTNEHVLRNGTQIEVELLDGRKFLGKALFKDSKNDLAVLKISANNLHPVTMGDSDSVELGEWVVGIGNPYGIGQSAMIGIVSAQKRTIPGAGYPPLIQIDAAMNLGNSGGPLFNLDGKVVGINTILLWKSQGIGFATPINVAKDFMEKKSHPPVKAASATSLGPLGPAADQPRSLPEPFNPLDPPWKFRR
ncbi:MAG: trypsin-like peptidase domain-containing protein [Desulfomonile tiedjei]|nr:trypsin-like peptidase domain-containing protein [Desulfomonile tiedjei]